MVEYKQNWIRSLMTSSPDCEVGEVERRDFKDSAQNFEWQLSLNLHDVARAMQDFKVRPGMLLHNVESTSLTNSNDTGEIEASKRCPYSLRDYFPFQQSVVRDSKLLGYHATDPTVSLSTRSDCVYPASLDVVRCLPFSHKCLSLNNRAFALSLKQVARVQVLGAYALVGRKIVPSDIPVIDF